MALRQSAENVRLMGAISRKAESIVRFIGPSRASRSGGFFVVRSQGSLRNIPAQAGTGDPDPRGSRRQARAQSAGPVGGNEAQAGYRWQSEPQGVRNRGAFQSAAQICILVCRVIAAQPTLVVKISDTSHWKERVRTPPLMSRTVEAPCEGSHAPRLLSFRKEGRELTH
jgi:hypothetical protein